MKKRINDVIKHPLITGSSIVLAGTFLANLLNYFFNLFLGRILSVSDYGLVISLLSLVMLFAIFQSTLSSIFAKFSAQYIARKDDDSFNTLQSKGFKVVGILGVSVFILICIFIPFLANFLHINNNILLFLISLYIFISILYSLPYGILQGEMRFFFLSFLNIFSAVAKIVFGIGFVLMGMGVVGALVGIVFSGLIPYLIGSYASFKKTKLGKIKDTAEKEILLDLRRYGSRFFLASLGLAVFTSLDTILVRHFFQPTVSGHYAALSLMGRSIFYLTTPIYFVLFPLIAKKIENKEKVFPTLILAGGLITFISLSISIIYFVFPSIILGIFFPAKEYIVLSSYLGPYSLYIYIFSIAFLFNNFFLSKGDTGVYKINLFSSAILVILISIFHQSLFQVIVILFLSSFLLLILLILYYINNARH